MCKMRKPTPPAPAPAPPPVLEQNAPEVSKTNTQANKAKGTKAYRAPSPNLSIGGTGKTKAGIGIGKSTK